MAPRFTRRSLARAGLGALFVPVPATAAPVALAARTPPDETITGVSVLTRTLPDGSESLMPAEFRIEHRGGRWDVAIRDVRDDPPAPAAVAVPPVPGDSFEVMAMVFDVAALDERHALLRLDRGPVGTWTATPLASRA